MDPLDILFSVRPNSRATACALRDMGLRAVIAEDGLRLVSCGAPKLTRGSDRRLGARYQPRDERGRFVTYWVLSHEIQNDLSDAGDHYTAAEDAWIAEWPNAA